MLHPRGKTVRTLALLTALCFVNLEIAALTQGRFVLPTASAAGKDQRVAIFVFPGSKGATGDAQVLQTLMREEAARLEGVRIVTGSPDPDVSAATLVGASVEDGFRALNVRDHATAAAAFSGAYDKLVRYTGPLDKRLLARVLKGLGVARVMAGQIRGGQEMMAASLNLWPDQLAPEYGYTLDVQNAFKETQRRHAEEATGGLAVVTDPPGAEVSVGGKVRGYTPVAVADLDAGLQWVQVSLDGYERLGAFVDIPAGDNAAQRFTLTPRADAAKYEDLMDKAQRSLSRRSLADDVTGPLRMMLGADSLVVLQLNTRGNSYELRGWHGGVSVDSLSTTIARDANFISNLQGFLSKTLGAHAVVAEANRPLDSPPSASVLATGREEEDLYIDPDDPILKTKSDAGGDSITKKWWFWLIVGGAVAGVTAGAVVLFSGNDSGSGPVGDINVDLNGL
ncbi:MAG: PEGA domain-containing protein [Deltaproteobacteria bacterium]|nr:PEGA domain-containing protein [Deltaproteobacteria bacterium]